MSEIKRVKINSILESQIPEFLNEESPLFAEFLKQYYYSLEHQSGTLDLSNNLKQYKNVETFNNEVLIRTTNLTSDVLSFDTVINVDSTIGWPDTYGLLKIDDEIITYLSKTETSFIDCVRGFSGIDNITSVENVEFLNFSSTNASEHLINSKVNNLSNLFLIEFFEKYRFEFFPGFESREFVPELSLPNILTGARDFYSSKGTDSSYKLLFKILYGTDIEIIRPQDNVLVPSSNLYFITKNILVEKISGTGNPTDLPGNFLYQTLPGIGTVSASIFNIEYRPVRDKELYEISLDSTSLDGTFQVSGKTKIMEDVQIGSDTILVDSTIGFNKQGTFIIKTQTSDLIKINYQDKTTNQFLKVTGVDRVLEFGTEVIEEKFATSFVGFGNTSPINFRIINVIDNVDSKNTSNMRVGDRIKLSGFGKDLSGRVSFNSWIYNIPTSHEIQTITKVNTNLFRVVLYDEVFFYLNEVITISDENKNKSNALITSIEYSEGKNKKFSNRILIQVDENSFNINNAIIITKNINKSNHNTNYFPGINKIPTGIQNTYLTSDGYSMYVTSTGTPNYTMVATDNKVTASTLGIGTTDTFFSLNHPYTTGETVYYQPKSSSGIGTGLYQLTKIDNNNFKLSFSKSDIFSKQYVQFDSGITDSEVVKAGYQNKNIENQKLVKKINLIPTPLLEIDDINRRKTTELNKQVGMLVNGVELFSPTVFDEIIYYGKLNSIEVIDSGVEYDVINSPSLEVTDDSGFGVKASLNISGSVKEVKILSPGVGYQTKPKITITGGNGTGCVLESNLVSSKITSSFKSDVGVSVLNNTITFEDPILFDDNEEVVYTSNGNASIPGILDQSNYFIGIVTNNVIKLYNNKKDSFDKANEINISGISSGIHNFTTLENKNTISEIYVKNSGKGYSNRSVRVPSVLSFDNNTIGINTFDSYIFAKNHGFNSGEIVRYSYTGSAISGLSSEVSYYVDVINFDKFKLASAGIGETLGNINLVNKRYESLSTLGVGTHIISYPPIEVNIESLSSIESATIIEPILKPIVLGSVENVFLENGGVSFGCTDIINFHRRPFVGVSSISSESLLKPIIINGSIVGVQIVNRGKGYRKDAYIVIEGSGQFAEIEATVENGSLVSTNILNGGIGYASTNTRLILQNRGVGLKLLANVNEWKINQVVKSKNIISGDDDGLIYPSQNPDLGLQFVNFYVPKKLRLQLSDNINPNFTEISGTTSHSPLLGYAYDGNPIYGPYGYETPLGGSIKRLVSGYIADVNINPELRPTGFEVGYFIDDYKFISTGDLDEYNGRFCVTPDFPNGIYAYFSTITVNSVGGGSGISIPTYPYVIGDKFKDVPILDNFLPKFNQDSDIFDPSLSRNIGPYYLNNTNSRYELIDNVLDDYKQELRVENINSDVILDAIVFSPGDNYQVDDLVLLDNSETEGSSANVVVSRIVGKSISNFEISDDVIDNVEFTIRSNNIVGETSSPHGLLNNQPIKISGISTVTSSNLEGIRSIKVNQKEVQLQNDIDLIGITGFSTKVVVTDTSGFEPNDFIGIGTEVLQITKISKKESYFEVNRISNTGVHTAGIDNVKLLPKKFEFSVDGEIVNYTFGNKTIFFNPKEDVGTGAAGTTRLVTGLSTSFSRIIPKRSIYIPGHKFFTGEKLIYNCGAGGTSLFVNNVGSGVSFILENGQEVYAVNLGKDYLGISTIGFTSTSGIGSQFNSLEFQNLDEFFGVIGVAHSLTTTNSKITGTIQNTSVKVNTVGNHGLLTGDEIKLTVNISDEEELKVIYDPINRKTAVKEISFTNIGVSTTNNTIDVSSYTGEIKTGDKVVYISDDTIDGLVNYGIYYVLKDSFNKIKLCEYISDIYPSESIFGTTLPINNIKFNSTGGPNQKLYFINPELTFFRGNTIKFDVSDTSLLDMDLFFYSDSDLNKKIEVIGSSEKGFFITREGVPGNPDSYVYLNTSVKDSPKVLYYGLVSKGIVDSEKSQISIDTSVVGNNHIVLLDHSFNDSFKVNVSDENSFSFVNRKNLTYIELQSLSTANITYDTNSKTVLGPISKLKINFSGRGYKKLPFVRGINSNLGTNAVIKLISPNIGRIESFSRVKDGFDYPTDPTLSPSLSVPSVVGIKDIRTIESVSILFGGKNYNTSPVLVVPENPEIKLQAISSSGSVESVQIIRNSTQLTGPLEIISTKNSNGFDIDFIVVAGSLVTLELLNTDLISSSFGSNDIVFPFEIGDEIFIENCRLTPDTANLNNYNSSDYKYKFFTVVGVDTNNYTVTYDISSLPAGVTFGTYDDTLNLGFIVNKKDMPVFEMNLVDTVSYFSNEVVTTNKFNAIVMENGWDQKLSQLRLDAGEGNLEIGDKLFGQTSKVNGTIEYFDTFILNSTLGVSRDKVGNIDNSVGILNEFQQRISDNFYYQKFSYSIKGDIPYDNWKEAVRSLVHPSGFKEFSDLIIYSEPEELSYSSSNLKPQILSSETQLNINIDNKSLLYERSNFSKVYEEDLLSDGSTERVYIADGLVLRPFIVNNTNKVLKIDDISNQFDGRSYQELEGRYADASDLLTYNNGFIQEEVVGFITATYPGITTNLDWDREIYKTNTGKVVEAIAHDVKYDSNNKSIEAGLAYWSGIGTNYIAGQEIETIAGFRYIIELSKFIINNVGVQTSYQLSTSFNISNLTYDNITGITTITTTDPHLLTSNEYVVLKDIVLSCDSGSGLSTAIFPNSGPGPDGKGILSPKGFAYQVNVVGVSTFTINPGISTIVHTYVSGGTVQKAFINASQEFDLTILKDTSCSNIFNENCCANVQSAIVNYVGIITNIIGIGTTAAPSEIIFPSLSRGGSVVGLSTFKLKNKGTSLFKHVFNSQSTTIDVTNNKFIIPNHNYQSGQKLIYEYDNFPIGVATTSYVSGITSSLIVVGNFDGTAIFENGYNVSISTTITGISTTLVPPGPSFQTYSSVIGFGTNGIDAEFNVFITYNNSTGIPIGTSIILNKGGRGFKVGDTVSIAGTYLGGLTPTNNLSFIVSKTAPTSISTQSNILYTNILSLDSNGSVFNVGRDDDGFVSTIEVVDGGVGYSSTSIISIAGTSIGGNIFDDITFSPIELGTKVLPRELYVLKLNDNEFRVSGLSTSVFLDLVGIGSGSHSLSYENPNSSVIITIDGVIQSALRRKSLEITLSEPISTATTTSINVSSGISSLNTNDIINIDNELLLVKSIGVSSENNIEVDRGYFDSIPGIHTVGAACTVLTGDFKIIGDTIYFTTPPYGKVGPVGLETGSTFAGRIFSRKFDPSSPMDMNIILDDISLSFTGSATSQFLLKSEGQSVQTLFNNVNDSSNINNNPIILINNVFQNPSDKYVIDDSVENNIEFVDGVPAAGKIVRVGITSGLGYQPLLVASAEATVSSSGTISSIILKGEGGGYRQPPVISIASTIGFGASVVATVGLGGTITGFTIIDPGFGYTTTSIPSVVIGIPTGYSNLPLEYFESSGSGQQAKITVDVGMGSSIISFKFDQPGFGYKVGDVLFVPGITTNPYFSGVSTTFLITVEEVQTDKFSGFYPGQFIKFSDISNQFNGFRKRFTLRAIINGESQIINLKTPIGSDLDITNNIFIYLNDVLQTPGESYTFSGSRLIFTEAPKSDSLCNIFYYRGSSVDVEEVVPPATIKEGDFIIIKENKNDPFDIDQFDRVVKNIISSDQFDTFTYDSIGISSDPNKERPLTWIKQQNDRIINGSIYSKARPDLKSVIRPQATIIKNVNISDDEIYVDNAYPIFSDVDGLSEDLRNLLMFENRIIESATAETQVSASSSVSSINVTFGGIGYQDTNLPTVLVSSSAITQKDPIFNWSGSVGISPSYSLNSVTYGNIFVGIGSTQSLIISPDGKTWQSSTIGLTTSSDLKSIISYPNNQEYIYSSVGSNGTVIRAIGSGQSISTWSNIPLREERIVPGFGVVANVDSSYFGILKDIVYSPSYDSYVTVGTAGSIFVGSGIGTNSFISKTSSVLSDLNSVSFSFNTSINSGYFVAVGNNGTILTSPSGQIWDVSPTFTAQNLNKVIFAEGKFVIVGNNGTVIKSINQNEYELIPTNVGVNFVNIKYNYGIYAALDDVGDLYYSLNLSKWDKRSTNQSNIITDLVFTDKLGVDGIYVAVGFGGTSVYAEPVYNRATGIASVSSGIVESIIVTNGGFGYSTLNLPQVIVESNTYNAEEIKSFKSIGDHGVIVGVNTFITGTPGIGTTNPKIEFVLRSETYDNSTLGVGYSALNSFGITESQLEKGDYFIITDSNVTVGHALTGITTSLGGMSNYPASKVGTARSFIDGVYRVEHVTTPVLGIVTVTCNFAPSPFGNFLQVYKRGDNNSGINTNNFYGRYSWGKIYDYQNRTLGNPKTFITNTDDGIIGLSSSPKVIRTRGLVSK
jgi:photosystem II stability/assembly factor-like uncharacterized protein